jgi:hypothetical protein
MKGNNLFYIFILQIMFEIKNQSWFGDFTKFIEFLSILGCIERMNLI